MQQPPKSFYPIMLALLALYGILSTAYIADYQADFKTVDIMKEQADEQREYIKKLITKCKKG